MQPPFGFWRGWMAGEDCVVVGCGPSFMPSTHAELARRWTIGCNRSVAVFRPDLVLCVEPWRDPIWDVIAASSPLVVFSHILPGHQRTVQIGTKDVSEWLGVPGEPLRLSQSPFFAAAVALHLGFECVGLIGVDYTEDRYPSLHNEEKAWHRLAGIATVKGARIVNLSPGSRLEAIPKAEWQTISPKSSGRTKTGRPGPTPPRYPCSAGGGATPTA